MKLMGRSHLVTSTAIALLALTVPLLEGGAQQAQPAAQQPSAAPPVAVVARLVAEPASLSMAAGEITGLKVTAYDAQGRAIPDAPMRVTGPRSAVSIRGDEVRALSAGRHEIVAMAMGANNEILTLTIPVTVTWPRLASVELSAKHPRLFVGTTVEHSIKAIHADRSERPRATGNWRSSDASVASVDRFGNVTAHKPGTVTISAEVDGTRGDIRHTVVANPVSTLTIDIVETDLRTGDVITLKSTAKRANGQTVTDVPIAWSYSYQPHDTIAAPGGAGVIDHGMFTAEVPGRYTLFATAGSASARKVFEVAPRQVRQRINVTGRGSITHVHTSDLWPWTAKDGLDYAIVGTWGGGGWAYIFDITDLTNMRKTDSVQVDARTINDVTVSPDGRYGVMSREGASNRLNGIVILDLANPAHPKIAAQFDERLTGGVHNMFATNEYLYAISGGDKYVIVDVRDIYKPRVAGEYDHPDSRVHDVWVHDGIAYSSEWGTGVVAVDVGNGKWGGSVEKPVLINTFAVTSGATHEIFPYVQKSTGKVYLFLGDEIMSRQGRVWEGTNYFGEMTTRGGVAQTSAGYTHIVDFTDPMNPKNVAKYHVEEFGAHDIVVENDILYQAYYDGGVRIVDVSGELLGNLYNQGREIAVFKPMDPQGFTANAPFVMNAMPWKGHILFTDFNTGLWSAKLEPPALTP